MFATFVNVASGVALKLWACIAGVSSYLIFNQTVCACVFLCVFLCVFVFFSVRDKEREPASLV